MEVSALSPLSANNSFEKENSVIGNKDVNCMYH